MSNPGTVTLSEEEFAMIQRAIKAADELATNVISGQRGGQRIALDFARELNELKRRKIVPNK